ncbi:VCBS repeat-containing protein [Streptomyces sp. NBC_00006]|uniref:FG-GAP repeat domain-containing protein n=1 Tax=unclassified Streptomyces TaxID=2593676 RepID=UPI00225AAFAE|nr:MULTISPECIES: VCBS repeat-containing protein [unclassified Streptomyces]MCX4827983.1 VCBS repeat-containing protein [Streptomyces sp. NBC_01016]MCX5532662.1 VCBS repeat-containing protein [Streptomyces sp. NBC_00006]
MLCAALLAAALTACGGHDSDSAGTHRPATVAGEQQRSAPLPVPRGKGSKLPSDFNGDGAPDLVLDDLAHDGLGDDPGIGVVYGRKGHGLVAGTRQLLTPAKYAARIKGQAPATFASEASCDLDRDGYADLVVSTDPPYDGQGMPPVPLQILFGSPTGISGKGVTLKIPARARFGNEWPDQPVCGDFDGDGRNDLVVHASGGRLSVLPGPFTRAGAPRGTTGIAQASGNVPTGPAADLNGDGTDDVLVRAHTGTARSAVALGGPNGFTKGATYPAGTDAVFGRFGAAVLGEAGLKLYAPGGRATRTVRVTGDRLAAADLNGDGRDELAVSDASDGVHLIGSGKPRRAPAKGHVIAVADYDGDGRDDLALQHTKGTTGATDTVTVLTGNRTAATLVSGTPQLTFSTTEFSN